MLFIVEGKVGNACDGTCQSALNVVQQRLGGARLSMFGLLCQGDSLARAILARGECLPQTGGGSEEHHHERCDKLSATVNTDVTPQDRNYSLVHGSHVR